MGGCSILAGAYLPAVRFSTMILVDPVLSSSSESGDQPPSLTAGIDVRRGIWTNPSQTVRYATTSGTLQSLDSRVVDRYVVCPREQACGAHPADSYCSRSMQCTDSLPGVVQIGGAWFQISRMTTRPYALSRSTPSRTVSYSRVSGRPRRPERCSPRVRPLARSMLLNTCPPCTWRRARPKVSQGHVCLPHADH